MKENDYLIKVSQEDLHLLFEGNKKDILKLFTGFSDLGISINGFFKLFKSVKPINDKHKILEEGNYIHIVCSQRIFVEHFNKTNGIFSSQGIFDDIEVSTFNLSNYEHNLIDKIIKDKSLGEYKSKTDVFKEISDVEEDVIFDYLEGFTDVLNQKVEVFRNKELILYYSKLEDTGQVGSFVMREDFIRDMVEINNLKCKDGDYIKTFWIDIINNSPSVVDELTSNGLISFIVYNKGFWEDIVENLISNPSIVKAKIFTVPLEI